MRTIAAKECFGEYEFFTNHPSIYSIRSEDYTTIYKFSR